MIEFPLYLPELQNGVITGVNADTLWVKLPDGRNVTVIINGDELKATYLGDYE